MTPTKPHKSRKSKRSSDGETVIWSKDVEGGGDWIRLPRTLCYLGRYDTELAHQLQPRHIMLLLNLAARKYKNNPIRAYWDELAADLGTKRATVRKWAYELEEMELLRISRHKGRAGIEGKPGRKNDRNTFNLSPFVEKIKAAHQIRRENKKKSAHDAGEEDEAI